MSRSQTKPKTPHSPRVHMLKSKTVTPHSGSINPNDSAEKDHSQLTKFNPIIHERTRLTILTSLATAENGCHSFIDLRDSLQVTDGNLVTHLRTLEHAGFITKKKEGAGRNSMTKIQLSKSGKEAFTSYLDQLETLVQTARSGSSIF